MKQPSPESAFVHVNGLRLHYLDWGGTSAPLGTGGQPLLFLAGMGSSAYDFDSIAPRFTDRFRVLALTRRGQGESDYPETGYELDTLVDDIQAFMASLGIEQAILAGHSLAGVELTRFAERYPHKVLKLIYLDAVYDPGGRFEVFQRNPLRDVRPPESQTEFDSVEAYAAHVKAQNPELAQIWLPAWDRSIAYDLVETAQGKFVEKDTSSISRQMLEGVRGYDPRRANIRVPVLSFVALATLRPPGHYTEEQKRIQIEFWRDNWTPFRKHENDMFKQDIPQAQVIEIPDGHHYCFLAQEELVYREMRKFLLGGGD